MGGNTMISVVRGGTIWTGGPTPRLHHGADLVIEDGRVATIEPRYAGRTDVEIDASGCLVAPGMINAHVHPGTSPRSRGLAEDTSLPAGAAYYHMTMPLQMYSPEVISPDDLAVIVEWDCLAMLLGGATTLVAEQFGTADAWVHLVERLGFRCELGVTYPSTYSAIGYYKDGQVVLGDPGDVGAGLVANLALHDRFHGAFGDRLRIHLSPHGPDTVPDEVLRETKRQAQARGIRIHLHVAQHKLEYAAVERRSGKSPVGYLDSIGFLGPDVLATHCTYVDDGDLAALARTRTNCVHVAYRKAKEAITSPFCELIKHGINVALATDSYSHDFLLEMKLAAMMGKLRAGSAGKLTAAQVLSCATWGAAKALSRPDLGRLDPGAQGDVIVVDLTTPFNAPVFDSPRALVYYSTVRDIRTTLVAGRPVVQRGRVLGSDMDAVRAHTTECCRRLWSGAAVRRVFPEGVTYSDPCAAH
jgi:cytosine/adenosine deaminase-related metal-dependent hydrolase